MLPVLCVVLASYPPSQCGPVALTAAAVNVRRTPYTGTAGSWSAVGRCAAGQSHACAGLHGGLEAEHATRGILLRGPAWCRTGVLQPPFMHFNVRKNIVVSTLQLLSPVATHVLLYMYVTTYNVWSHQQATCQCSLLLPLLWCVCWHSLVKPSAGALVGVPASGTGCWHAPRWTCSQ